MIGTRQIQQVSARPDGDSTSSIPTSLIDDTLIDAYLQDRLSIQLLCDHYIGLSKGNVGGVISFDANLVTVIQDAITEASNM